MKKKALAALLVTAMVLSTAACGSGTNTSSESGSNDSAAADSTSKDVASADSTASAETSADSTSKDAASMNDPWANIDTSEHVVITYMVTGEAPSGEKLERYNEMLGQLNAILTEKVNAELETYFISWTDYLSNYNLALAQMDGSIDLVGTASGHAAWIERFRRHQNITELTRHIAVTLIERIEVHEGGCIEIRFKYQDSYECAMALIEGVNQMHPLETPCMQAEKKTVSEKGVL